MTAIVGLVEPGMRVWLGGDRALNNAGNVYTSAAPKIFKRGEFLIGCAGAGRFLELMRHVFTPPPFVEDANADDFIVGDFMTAVRTMLGEHGALVAEEGQETTGDGGALVAVRGSLYLVDGYFSAARVDTHATVGCGAPYALGSFYSTQGIDDGRKRVTLALEAAAAHCEGVRGPFDVDFVGEDFTGTWAKELAGDAKGLMKTKDVDKAIRKVNAARR